MFVGIILVKPSRDFICPLRMPKGLKGLLHMLNAIVFFHERGLANHLFMLLLSFYFSFCFVKGLAKCKFGCI
jgi:hypothetical protein